MTNVVTAAQPTPIMTHPSPQRETTARRGCPAVAMRAAMNRDAAALLLLCAMLTFAPAANAEAPELWVYAPVNFQVNTQVDQLIALLQRAKDAGYSAAVITDYKFGKMHDRPDHFYANLRRTRDAADRIGIELIPCVCPIGYSGSILQNNPNLAAALPVREAPFRVTAGRAAPAQPDNLLPGGAFEHADRRGPAGFDWIDGFGVSTTLDREIKHGGAASLRMTDFRKGNEVGNCRVVKNLTLAPWRQYRLSMWVKTRDVDRIGEFHVKPLVGNAALNYANLGVKPTQDWTRHAVVFNTQQHADVRLYIGLWGGRDGTIWIDDVELCEVGGVNLLRRAGCPIAVTSADGKTVYEEGRDFKPWRDPKLGVTPYAGEFSDDHDGPPLELTDATRIPDGATLLVSYYHTALIYDGQVSCALVADELFEHLARQIKLIAQHLRPKRYFMQHDEIRLAGHDALAQGRTAGRLLAENVQRCTEIIRAADPEATAMVWSDMFDPHHNARDNYYLVASTLRGSWEGLAPGVVIVNWNGGRRAESLRFFAERGHRQVVAGYYDSGDRVAEHTRAWLDAAKDVDGVTAFLYTTWRRDYSQLERFARLVRDAEQPAPADR